MTNHSEAEVLAAFVEGRLAGQELTEVVEHLQQCEECRAMIGAAVAFEREETKPRRAWVPVAAAAAIAGIVAALSARSYLHERGIRETMQQLFAAQAGGERRIDGRYSGQNTYASPHRTLRGETDVPGETEVPFEIQAAAMAVIQKTKDDHSPTAQAAHAIATATLQGRPTIAADGLVHISTHRRDARLWNDLAAAKYATAVYEGKPQLLNEALAAVDEALRLKPKMPEALFNRALILQRKDSSQAEQAWNAYLAVDPNSDWAKEAQENLRRLKPEPQ